MSFKMKSLEEVLEEIKSRGVVPLPEDGIEGEDFEEFLRIRTKHYKYLNKSLMKKENE